MRYNAAIERFRAAAEIRDRLREQLSPAPRADLDAETHARLCDALALASRRVEELRGA